jgi:hypothetical protein
VAVLVQQHVLALRGGGQAQWVGAVGGCGDGRGGRMDDASVCQCGGSSSEKSPLPAVAVMTPYLPAHPCYYYKSA